MGESSEERADRLAAVVDLVTRIASGDFGARLPVSGRRDDVDAVIVALHMLAEDFATERARRTRAEALLEDALDGYQEAPALLCSVDVDTGVVTQCNATMARALGWPAEEIVGRPLVDRYVGGAHEQASASLEALIAGAPVPAGDHLLSTRDGRTLRMLLSGSVVRDDDGRARRVRLLFRDVTVERHLEAQLTQAQKLESIGRLAGGIAHDFNNLLTAILSFAELLRPAQSSDEAREDLGQLITASQRAAELTGQLLAFSRQTVVKPEVLDVNARLRQMSKLLRRVLPDDVTLELREDKGAWPVVIDPLRLEQILMNLVVNARDAMPGGGTLCISTSNQRVAADEHAGLDGGDVVAIAVADTGTGIDPAGLPHLFEPFFTTKPVGQGTGLGLATVHGIVTQARGIIVVESEPGQGATFTVLLPRADGRPVTASDAPAAAPTAGQERILVVEDDALVRSLLVRSLKRGGYAVTAVEDGAAALDAVSEAPSRFDLVITDGVMPRLSGLDLVRALRAAGHLVPVIVISGHAEGKLARDGALPPDVPLLRKPFSPDELLRRVRTTLDVVRVT